MTEVLGLRKHIWGEIGCDGRKIMKNIEKVVLIAFTDGAN